MFFQQRHGWVERRVRLLAVFVIFLLLLSATGGFFTYDFFTLWGLHPKWVWATGHFASSGADLPTGIAYQSFLGSITGWFVRIIGVRQYPDALWGVVNVSVTALVLYGALKIRRGFKSSGQTLAFVLTLLFLAPREFKQGTFGGYADLLTTSLLSLAICSWWENALALSLSACVLAVLLKPPLWIWVLLFGAVSISKKRMRDSGLILASALLGLGFTRLIYGSPQASAAQALAPLGIHVVARASWDWCKLPFAILLSNNGLVLLWGAFCIFASRKARDPFWGCYAIVSYLFLLLFYAFVMGSTGSETFASIHRYTLPLILPAAIFFCTDFEQRNIFTRPRVFQILLSLVLVATCVRVFEEVDLLVRHPMTQRWHVCQDSDPVCMAAQAAQAMAHKTPSCPSWVLTDKFMSKYFADGTFNTLTKIKVIYMALPTLTYLSNEPRKAPPAEACLLENHHE